MDRLTYVVENLGISAGYFFFAVYVVTLLPIRARTLFAGRAFFALCASTHVEHAVHAAFNWQAPMWTEGHSHFIHATQVVAVWLFAVWFRQDMKALLLQWRSRSVTQRRRMSDRPPALSKSTTPVPIPRDELEAMRDKLR